MKKSSNSYSIINIINNYYVPKKNLITHFNLKEIKVENNLFIQEKE